MSLKLKPIDQQVIVITGASSGIGRATAQTAIDQGAHVVAVARSKQKLEELVRGWGSSGIAIPADVSQREQLEEAANRAIETFGRIDTWINDAGVSIYGRLDEVNDADSRRLFDINFWGIVYGSLVALPYLRRQGGALINLGSEVSDAVIPLQGMYSASKHAVKGFTDALRVEIEEVDKAPVSITLIQPTAVDTAFPRHARNYMDREPKLPDPKIDPQKVADAILSAATKPARHIKVGMNAKLHTFMAKNAPGVAEHMAAKQTGTQQKETGPRHPEGTLYQAGEMVEQDA